MAGLTSARVVTFGQSAGADVRAAEVSLDQTGRPAFTLVTSSGSAAVRLRLHGEHNVSNALAAAALAAEAGLSLPEIAAGLSAAQARSRWRMEVTERPDGVTVINDAYNTNPEALGAALASLAAMARGRRAYAVLGHMRELGAQSAALNEQAGALAARTGLAGLVVVGDEAGPMLAGARAEPGWRGELLHVADGPAATRALAERLRPGDIVLVKASRAAGLQTVALALAGAAEVSQ